MLIPCSATAGDSPPVVSWTRFDNEGKPVNYGSELRFNSVKQDDAGYYECRASNGADKDLVSKIKLDVLGKYRDVIFLSAISVR